MKRRVFLGNLLAVGSVAGVSSALADQCLKVPASAAGPMKPLVRPMLENDLTRIRENGPQAAGRLITLSGQVLTADCEPLAGAEVVIWQACVNGMYDHPNEERSDWLDPNFRYEGRTTADEQGRYQFQTIIPGSYPVPTKADPGLGLVSFRAPHIHFTVTPADGEPFTSQMFFDLFDDMNKYDLVLYRKTQMEQRRLTASVTETRGGEPDQCQFDIVI